MKHTVKREGRWFVTLAEAVRNANMGDTIVVDDTEMMSFACFGIRARGFKDTSKQFGITVELPNGVGGDVEKVTASSNRPSPQNIPKHLDYPDDQVFICQHCNEPYQHGPARDVMRDSGQTKYTPLAFCSSVCGFRYHYKHGRGPGVVAEIPLGKPEPYNLTHFKASESVLVDPANPDVPVAKVYDEAMEVPDDLMEINGVSKLLGLEPVGGTKVDTREVPQVPEPTKPPVRTLPKLNELSQFFKKPK